MDSTQVNRLAGKGAIVVGGGRGLGREIALGLASQGVNLAILSRSNWEIEAVASECQELRSQATAIVCDASDAEEVELAMEDAVARLGSLDILVNSQGQSQIKYVEEITDTEWRHVLDANLSSVFYSCRYAFREMKARGNGHIVNVSSAASVDGSGQAAGYLAAKAGVVGLSRALAKEGKQFGIRVNVVCPGSMNTKMQWEAIPNADRQKLMDPARVASLVVWLVNQPDLSFNGPMIPVSMWQ